MNVLNVTWKPVVTLIRNYDKVILNLTLVDAEGTEEILGVTPEHPFWVEGEKWIEAGNLIAGMQVITLKDDKKLTVKLIEKDELKQSTYNFEVEDFHTYFVGNTGAWVHNACGDDLVDLASPQRRRHILDGDSTGGGHRPDTGIPGKSEFLPVGQMTRLCTKYLILRLTRIQLHIQVVVDEQLLKEQEMALILG